MTVTQNKKPTHRIYAVRKTAGKNSRWTEIGASWPNRVGFNLKFNLWPVGDADIILREIEIDNEPVDAEGGAQ